MLNADDLNNAEIILRITDALGNVPVVRSQILHDLIQDVMATFNIRFEPILETNTYNMYFKDFASYRHFHTNVLPQHRLETPPSQKPYRVQVQYTRVPSGISVNDLYEMSVRPYNAMGIDVKRCPEPETFELSFPSDETFFITMLSVLGLTPDTLAKGFLN